MKVYHLQGNLLSIPPTKEAVLERFRAGDLWRLVAEVQTNDPIQASVRTTSMGIFHWSTYTDVHPYTPHATRSTEPGDIFVNDEGLAYLKMQLGNLVLGRL